jgi:Protein of unknown function (DUF3431)
MIRDYVLKRAGKPKSSNLLFHPNGKLYGDLSRIGCYRWCLWEEQIVFFDGFGSIRMIFQPANDRWEYRPLPVEGPPDTLTRRGFVELPGHGRIRMRTPLADHELAPQQLPLSKQQFEVVIAKFKEDISWAECIQSNRTIYAKDPEERLGFRILPNLGREGGTYLFHIVENYDRLADRTLFLQGDPFAHPLVPFEEFATGLMPFWAAPAMRQTMEWRVPWSSPSQSIDRPVMRDFLRLLESDPNISDFFWTQGAQFALSREQIRSRPLTYYRKLWDFTQQPAVTLANRQFDNHHVAWLFELFWRHVFLAENI